MKPDPLSVKDGHLSSWRGSDKASTEHAGWVGGGMHGRSCSVNQGDLSGSRREFIVPDKDTKSQPVRSQSVHSSEEAA